MLEFDDNYDVIIANQSFSDLYREERIKRKKDRLATKEHNKQKAKDFFNEGTSL